MYSKGPVGRPAKPAAKAKKKRRAYASDSDEDDSYEEEDYEADELPVPPGPKQEPDESDDDEPCGVCGDSATWEEEEAWVQCDKCQKWFHFECTGLKKLPTDDEQYLCEECDKY
jgi:hypothetical protein